MEDSDLAPKGIHERPAQEETIEHDEYVVGGIHLQKSPDRKHSENYKNCDTLPSETE